MGAWKTRIVAAAAALLITGTAFVLAELGGLYVTNKAEIAGKPAPQEYTIYLKPIQPPHPHNGP